MDTDIHLDTAPREVLIGLIVRQQGVIQEQQPVVAQLQRRIESLEGKAKPGSPRGMPGLKPKADGKPAQPKKPRKPRRQGFARSRMTPTQRVEHALDSCPDCGTGLAGGWVQRTREVIELPQVPVQVTEHAYIARNCPVCERRRMPQGGPAGAAVSGKQRLGSNLLALIAALREEGPTAFPRHPVVSEDGASVDAQLGGHSGCHPQSG